MKSLLDADAQAVDILTAYFDNCQRNMVGQGGAFKKSFIDFCKMQDKLKSF